MDRTLLSDRQWELIAPLLPGKASDPGRTGDDNRRTIEGILYIMRTGSPWRDLPREFGHWNSVHRTFRRWSVGGVFDRIFEAASEEPDLQAVMVDGTFSMVHQHGTGAKKAGARPTSQQSGKPSDEVEVG